MEVNQLKFELKKSKPTLEHKRLTEVFRRKEDVIRFKN